MLPDCALKRYRPHCMTVVLCLLLLCGSTRTQAQSIRLPATYYTLRTNEQRALFLKHAISDSVDANRNGSVPAMAHLAIGLARGTAADTLVPQVESLLGDAYNQTQPDSAPYYYRLAYITTKRPTVTRKIYLLESLVYAFSALQKQDSMLHAVAELKAVATPLPASDSRKINALNTIANGYADASLYDSAISNFKLIMQQATATHDSAILGTALVNVGLVYNMIASNDQAVYYTLQALPYIKKGSDGEKMLYYNLAHYYAELHRPDSAQIYINKGLKAAAALHDTNTLQSLNIVQALISTEEKHYEKAEALLQQSISTLERQPPGVDLVNGLLAYASLDTITNRYAQANAHLRKLYAITQQMGQRAYRIETLRFLAAVNAHLGNYKDAYTFQQAWQAATDSVKTDKLNAALSQLKTEYRLYQEQEQNTQLKKSARISQLELQAARRNKQWLAVVIAILVIGFSLLLYGRSQRAKNRLQATRADLEMKTLRSQMNPHFIFNALNSIQKYIWENRRDDAAAYLTKFARLTRMVLENSQHQSIPLGEELKALNLYIEMEHRRSNQQFDYTITVAPDVDTETVRIPPLLLQPYVENAIWHGLSNLEGQGHLTISITQQGGMLHCLIDDDGVGRAQAAAIRNKPKEHQSMAMNLSGRRIAWLQQTGGQGARVVVEDKYLDGKAAGTQVLLVLPLQATYD